MWLNETSKTKLSLILLILSFNLMFLSIGLLTDFNGSFGAFGIISVLPWPYFVGLAAFTLIYLYLLYTRKSRLMLAGATLLLAIVLFGTPLLLEKTPRFSYSFITGGTLDYVLRTGHVNTSWDAIGLISMFQNWPGVFYLGAAVSLLGNVSLPDILKFTPVVSQLLYLLPLYLIFTTIFRNPMHIFVGCTFFYLANWVNQDYFCSQNMGLFLTLLAFALILKMIVTDRYEARSVILFGIVYAAIVITHGLTSLFAYLSIAGILAVIAYRDYRWHKKIRASAAFMIAFATGLLGAWSYLAADFGQLSRALDSLRGMSILNVINHIFEAQSLGSSTASDPQMAAILSGLKILGALLFAGIAVAGFVYYYRGRSLPGRRRLDMVTAFFLMMLAANFILYITPLYTNESIIRIFLLSIITLVYFTVRMLDNKRLATVVLVFMILAVPLSLLNHYSKESVDYTSPASMSGLDFLFDKSTPGSLLRGISLDAYKNYEQYAHESIDFRLIDGLYDFENNTDRTAYTIMNSGARNFADASMTSAYEQTLSFESNLVFEGGDYDLYYSGGSRRIQ